MSIQDDSQLKTFPRRFKEFHRSNAKLLRVKGINMIKMGQRGGDLKKLLALIECKWIMRLNTIYPNGLNEMLSLAPSL